jgi:hypothetical protein
MHQIVDSLSFIYIVDCLDIECGHQSQSLSKGLPIWRWFHNSETRYQPFLL